MCGWTLYFINKLCGVRSVMIFCTVESGYKVYVCPRGSLLYCRPYFINDPTVKSHRRVAYTLPSLCSLEFHFFNQELKSNDVIHAFLLASYATGRFLIFFMHLGTRHPAVFEAYLPSSIMMLCRNSLFNFPSVTSLSTACKQTKLDANRSAVCKMTHAFHQGSHFRVNSDVLTLTIYFINGFIYFITSRFLL